MSDRPPDDDSDIDAAYERALDDPAYAAKLQEQVNAELEQVYTEPATCGDCLTVLLEDEFGHQYCPNCDGDEYEEYLYDREP
jgi:predicted nucleotidyltransferase